MGENIDFSRFIMPKWCGKFEQITINQLVMNMNKWYH